MAENAKATTRAKFVCRYVEKNNYGGEEVVLSPVTPTADVPENERFWKATPNGEVRLSIDNPAAQGRFETGKSYYVDFTPAQ